MPRRKKGLLTRIMEQRTPEEIATILDETKRIFEKIAGEPYQEQPRHTTPPTPAPAAPPADLPYAEPAGHRRHAGRKSEPA